MDNVEEVKKVITEKKHHFYCDSCLKYLGTSTEYDDGYYEEFGEFEINLGRYHLQKHFCEVCRDEFMDNYEESLIKLGFTKE